MAGVRTPAKDGLNPQKVSESAHAKAIPANVISACEPSSADAPSLVEVHREKATTIKSETIATVATSVNRVDFVKGAGEVELIMKPSLQITSDHP